MLTLNFKLHKDLKERLIECAWKARMKQSEFIREAIIRFCEETDEKLRSNSIQGD